MHDHVRDLQEQRRQSASSLLIASHLTQRAVLEVGPSSTVIVLLWYEGLHAGQEPDPIICAGTCVLRGCVPKKLMVIGGEFVTAFHDSKAFGCALAHCIPVKAASSTELATSG